MNKIVLFYVFGTLLCSAVSAYSALSNPHNFKPAPVCTDCHIKSPPVTDALNTKNMPVDLAAFKKDGVALCTDCHSSQAEHMVGVKINFTIPSSLPLDKANKVNCLTCHYTHGSLLSEQPQASYNFMDVLFDSEQLRKSFLLRHSNVNGELCLICHDFPN